MGTVGSQLTGASPYLVITTLLLPIIILRLYVRFYSSRIIPQAGIQRVVSGKRPKSRDVSGITVSTRKDVASTQQSIEKSTVLSSLRLMFHELHNIEHFPHATDKALCFLQAMLSTTTREAELCSKEPNILHLIGFDPESLSRFIAEWDDSVHNQWQKYLEGRRLQLQPRQLFEDASAARDWLKRISPSKFVDGSWLGHASITMANPALQKVHRSLWQTLSEEYGDGSLLKNHVHVFRKLLQTQVPDFPDPSHPQFINPTLGIDSIDSWASAVTQLAIAHALDRLDFLPELLGFNLHFELVALETLQAMYELREVGLDPSYFTLHVTIDNSDSGHTAMALNAVTQYMQIVTKSMGQAASNNVWTRIQAGFCLSQFAPSLPVSALASVHAQVSTLDIRYHNSPRVLSQVIDIVRRKSLVSAKIHCGSQLRLRGKRLIDWMSPESLLQEEHVKNFVSALASTRPWVYRGDSKRSLLVKEISWGGRMFGAFTDKEVDIMNYWIDTMDTYSSPEMGQDDCISPLPPSLPTPIKPLPPSWDQIGAHHKRLARPPPDFLAMWIVAPCVLESFLRIPSKAANCFGAHILSILRAQYGFTNTRSSVTGMDSARLDCDNALSLENIIHDTIAQDTVAPINASPLHLTDRRAWLLQSEFCSQVIAFATRPWGNVPLLLGVAKGFVELHRMCMGSDSPLLLSSQHQSALKQIVAIEEVNVDRCIALMHDDELIDSKPSVMLGVKHGNDMVKQEVMRLLC